MLFFPLPAINLLKTFFRRAKSGNRLIEKTGFNLRIICFHRLCLWLAVWLRFWLWLAAWLRL
ncbi:MAG: hypothetical protein EA408_09445 [Marinilabiliales bacterium]|nr:MAG: hypothetical protein EA408_09445 [Marinilabiliales bacterium]